LLRNKNCQQESDTLNDIHWQWHSNNENLVPLIKELNNHDQTLNIKVIKSIALQNVLEQHSTLIRIDDPSHLHGLHLDWDTLVVWIHLVLEHFQSIEVIVDVDTLGVSNRDDLFVPGLIDFQDLLFKHLLGLHRQFCQVSAERIVIC